MTDSLAGPRAVEPPARVSNALAEIAGRVPPQALAAEAAVLASMMLDGAAANTVVEMLEPEDFYRPAHQKICAAIFRLFERNEAIDLITLTEELRRAQDLEKVGGSVYLAELLETTTSAAIVEHYAHIVRERSTLRRLARASLEIADECYSSPEDVKSTLDRAEQKIFEISESGLGKGFVSIKDILVDSFEAIEKLFQNKRLITGVPSGFFDLDGYTSGFQPSEFIVIAARPSMGKTALALNVAQHVAVQQKLPVAVFSLEMSKESLVHRLLAAEARVDGTRLRTGFLHENEWPRLTTAAGRLGDADLYIDDTAGLTALEIRAKTRRLMAETKGRLAMVMIDYMQLIRGHGRQENRQQEISTISRSLKALAKEMRIPVIALSQLKRPTDVREGARRPMLSDLRECVVGDTRVVLADGRRVPIRELVGTTPEVQAMNANGLLECAQSDKVWRVGARPVFEIALASGRTLKATSEHRILSGAGWQTLESIRIGDRVALARRILEPKATVAWPRDRVILLAHLLGDGSYLSGQPMRYATASEECSQAVTVAARSEFGLKVTRYKGRGRWHQLLLSGNGNRWRPAGANAWLRELGVFGQRSHEKRVPTEVFRFSNEQVALFLRHLWATDGTIHRRSEKSRGGSVAHFTSSSRGLADDVAALLLRLGFVARIRELDDGTHRPWYCVCLEGSETLRRFLDVVGGWGPRALGARRVREALSGVESNPNVDTVPIETFQLVRARMKSLGISHRKMAQLRGTSYGGSAHFAFAPSRRIVAEYAELLDDAQLRELSSNDLFWDRVTSITPCGVEDVYDLTVPGLANWLADGIVSHNSGAIEQDADVVIFINRPEIYNPTPENEGIAEIILGKQRNGPIGTVQLSFQKAHTRFESLTRVRE
jgi:replicative DNA helicase